MHASGDYYDPSPSIALELPVVLCGHLGCGAAQAARNISARTGLPFHDIDRVIENAAGRSLAHLALEQSGAALRPLARDALTRVLARRPPGIVALGAAALSPDDLDPLIDRARFVYLRRPAEVLLARIREQVARSPGSLFQFQLAVPQSVEELEPWLEDGEAALTRAHVIIDAGDRHPQRLAAELIEALEHFVGVRDLRRQRVHGERA